jgi:hypothetical protein
MVDRPASLLVLLMFSSLAQAQPAPEPPSAGIPSAGPAAPPAGATAPAADAPATRGSVLETHIEQVKRGNRVTEVRVTGAEGQRRYTMDNPEGRPPSQFQGPGSGLSTPNFLNIEF